MQSYGVKGLKGYTVTWLDLSPLPLPKWGGERLLSYMLPYYAVGGLLPHLGEAGRG